MVRCGGFERTDIDFLNSYLSSFPPSFSILIFLSSLISYVSLLPHPKVFKFPCIYKECSCISLRLLQRTFLSLSSASSFLIPFARFLWGKYFFPFLDLNFSNFCRFVFCHLLWFCRLHFLWGTFFYVSFYPHCYAFWLTLLCFPFFSLRRYVLWFPQLRFLWRTFPGQSTCMYFIRSVRGWGENVPRLQSCKLEGGNSMYSIVAFAGRWSRVP